MDNQEGIILKLILYCKNNNYHLIEYKLQKENHEAIIASNENNTKEKLIYINDKKKWQYFKDTKEDIFKEQTIAIYKTVLKEDSRFPQMFWTGDLGKKRACICLRYLCENILGYKIEEIPEKLTRDIIKEYKLNGLLKSQFNDVLSSLVKAVYKDKFYAWEFKCMPRNFWKTKENRLEAFVWYLEQNKNEFGKNNKILTKKHMYQHKLSGLVNYYNGSMLQMIKELEPEIKEYKKKQHRIKKQYVAQED